MPNEVELILEPSPVGVGPGFVNYGDVYTPNLSVIFDSGAVTAVIGQGLKNGPEVAGFFRFDMPAALPELTITRVKLELTNNATGLNDPQVRIGFLLRDGLWDDTGFRLVSDGGGYADAAALPHPTADGSDVIIGGILPLNAFFNLDATGLPEIDLLSADWTAGAVRTFGRGYVVDDLMDASWTLVFDAFYNTLGYRQFGLVIDPFDPGTGPERVTVHSGDALTASLRPKLYVTFQPTEAGVCTVGHGVQSAVEAVGVDVDGAIARAGVEAAAALAVVGITRDHAIQHVGAEVLPLVEIVGAVIEECD